jgi:hypothetical protein
VARRAGADEQVHRRGRVETCFYTGRHPSEVPDDVLSPAGQRAGRHRATPDLATGAWWRLFDVGTRRGLGFRSGLA